MHKFFTIIFSIIFILPNGQSYQAEIDGLNLSSQNYILYNFESDQVIASKNADQKLSVASMNKILTTITLLDYLAKTDFNSRIILEDDILDLVPIEASKAGFYAGQSLSIYDLLYGILLPSGADAITILSEYIFSNQSDLVVAMNKKAQSLGMINTSIKNNIGLDQEGQYTTLSDMLTLVRAAIRNDDFKEIFGKKYYQLSNDPNFVLENQSLTRAEYLGFNQMLGAKSGYTLDTGRALSSYASNGEASYIFISTGAKTAYYDTSLAVDDAVNVYNYLFSNFSLDKINDQADNQSVKVKWHLNPISLESKSIEAYLPKSYDPSKLEIEYKYLEDLKAPLDSGSIIGEQIITYQGEEIANIDIKLSESVRISWPYKIILIFLALTIIMIIYKLLKRKKIV